MSQSDGRGRQRHRRGAGESTGVIATKRDDGVPTQLEGLTWANTQTGQSADLSLATDGLPAAYTDSSGMEARFSDYQLSDAASSVTVSFFRNGAAQGNPATVPVDGAWLRALQTMAERVRLAVQGASASTGRQVAPTMSGVRPADTRRQPVALYLERAAGQQLLVWQCRRRRYPVRRARCRRRAGRREQLGRPDGLPVAADRRVPGPGRHPPRRGGRTARVRHRSAGAAGLAGRCTDVVEAPCGPAGGGVSCLAPVATQLTNPSGRVRPSAHLASGGALG